MDKIEVRFSRPKLIFYSILILAIVTTSSYVLFLTDTFQIATKVFGTMANIGLLYLVFRKTLERLMKNDLELTADKTKLGFRNKGIWKEILWLEIKDLSFKKVYDGYRISKTLIVDTISGEKEEINLNDLDVDWDTLKNRLDELRNNKTD